LIKRITFFSIHYLTKDPIPYLIDHISFVIQLASQIPSMKFNRARAVVKGGKNERESGGHIDEETKRRRDEETEGHRD
jgi:hypothetical protein